MPKPKFDPSQPLDNIKPKFDPSKPLDQEDPQTVVKRKLSDQTARNKAQIYEGLSGASYGLSDRAISNLAEYINPGTGEQFVTNRKKYKTEHPYESAAANIGGNILSALSGVGLVSKFAPATMAALKGLPAAAKYLGSAGLAGTQNVASEFGQANLEPKGLQREANYPMAAATGVGAGLVFPPVLKALGKTGGWLGSKLAGTDADTASQYLNNVERIKSSPSTEQLRSSLQNYIGGLQDKAATMTQDLPKEIGQGVENYVRDLNQKYYDLSTSAYESMPKNLFFSKRDLIEDIGKLKKKTGSLGGEAQNAKIDEYIALVEKNFPDSISAEQMKDLKIDLSTKDINWTDPHGTRASKDVRSVVDSKLKGKSAESDDFLAQASHVAGVRDKIQEGIGKVKFGPANPEFSSIDGSPIDPFNPQYTNTTIAGKIRGIGKNSDQKTLEVLNLIKENGGPDFINAQKAVTDAQEKFLPYSSLKIKPDQSSRIQSFLEGYDPKQFDQSALVKNLSGGLDNPKLEQQILDRNLINPLEQTSDKGRTRILNALTGTENPREFLDLIKPSVDAYQNMIRPEFFNLYAPSVLRPVEQQLTNRRK